MPTFIEAPSLDLSHLDGEDFQVALRVAMNDLKDQEAIFAEFLREAGNPDKSHWRRTVQYSHLHLLFAQEIVSTLLIESDRRSIAHTSHFQPGIGAATSAAMGLAQVQLQKSEAANCEPLAPILGYRDHQQPALDHDPRKEHAHVDHQHEIGLASRRLLITRPRLIIIGRHFSADAAERLERHCRWSRAVHWEFRPHLLRTAFESSLRASAASTSVECSSSIAAIIS